MGVLRTKEIMNPRILYYLLKDNKFNEHLRQNIYGANINNINKRILESFKIPTPTIEIQNEMVEELNGYQKIIDGCRQVIKNYKPSIYIDPSWKKIPLGELPIINLDDFNKVKKLLNLIEGKSLKFKLFFNLEYSLSIISEPSSLFGYTTM